MGALAIGLQGIMAETASAHSLTVTASASCDSKNNAVINFTVTSWETTGVPSANNPDIQVTFNGSSVFTGAFTAANSDQFSKQEPAPNGQTSVTVTATAIDPWGDGFGAGETDSKTVTIPTSCATGRFTGGGKELDLANGVYVTQGLELDCDLNPSDNLEVNWAGNHFHMENFLSAFCSLVSNPAPPAAPINTMIGVGTGRYNGAEGYTVNFTLVDNGEPGHNNDEIAITIFQTSDPTNVILSFPLTTLVGGNLQAHPDQR
jgi:hypothetical protein